MREIKFRAWNKVLKTMDYQPQVPGSEPDFDLNSSFACLAMEDSPEVVMQYTGLKDKNGKEIYEGDIVEHTKEGWFGICDWCNGVVTLTGNPLGNLTLGSYFQEHLEIIGNIYENQELMDSSQHDADTQS